MGNAARKYLIETPERAVYSIKRLMGRGLEDIREELKLFPFRLAEDLQPGEVLRSDKDLIVAAGKGALSLTEVQLEGKRRMTAAEFLRGHGALILRPD